MKPTSEAARRHMQQTSVAVWPADEETSGHADIPRVSGAWTIGFSVRIVQDLSIGTGSINTEGCSYVCQQINGS